MRRFKKYLFLLFCFLALGAYAQSDELDVLIFSRYSQANWQIWAKRLDSGEEKQLTHSAVDKRNPQWANSTLFYRTANSEVYLFNLRQGSQQRILQRFETIMDQRWSPDGKRVTFARMRSDLPDDSDIWVSDITGKEARCLTNASGLQYAPVFSPDQQSIVYVSTNEAGGQTLFRLSLEGQENKQLTQGKSYDVFPAFSPQGGAIVFSSNRGGSYNIWQVDSEGTNLSQLTDSLDIDTMPVFSPDGERIAFIALQSGSLQIWSMAKDGGDLRAHTSDDNSPCQDPLWVRMPETLWSDMGSSGDE